MARVDLLRVLHRGHVRARWRAQYNEEIFGPLHVAFRSASPISRTAVDPFDARLRWPTPTTSPPC